MNNEASKGYNLDGYNPNAVAKPHYETPIGKNKTYTEEVKFQCRIYRIYTHHIMKGKPNIV